MVEPRTRNDNNMTRKKSFEKRRENLNKELANVGSQQTVKQDVKFTNASVPEYLDYLSNFEKDSRGSNLMVG